MLALVHSTSATHWVEGAAQITRISINPSNDNYISGIYIDIDSNYIDPNISSINIDNNYIDNNDDSIVITIIDPNNDNNNETSVTCTTLRVALTVHYTALLCSDPPYRWCTGAYTTLQVVGATYK